MPSMSAAPHPFQPGHLVMVDIPGTSLDAATADFLRRHHVRAICLFRRNLGTEDEVRQLTADLREAMGPHALIGIDQEGGSTVRATFLPQAPAAMALGAIGDEALCEEVGAVVARGLRSLGINWNFAPVLDVNNNPGNPVIAERSFGEDPDQVARLAGAWMRGSLREGVACCVKHFPGHGDTAVDSHHALPTVDKAIAELEALELKPFRALAHAHGDTPAAPAVMTAHIVYPRIDPEHPATLSRPVLTGLLREAIGYDGVVITDALMMKAVHDKYGHALAAVMALQAGADMPLAQGSLDEQAATVRAIERALHDGQLLPADVKRSAARLEALAAAYPVSHRAYAPAQRAADDALMRQAWARGLTAFDGAGKRAAPPSYKTPLRVVTQDAVACDGVSEAGLSAERIEPLFHSFDDVQFVRVPDLREIDAAAFPQDGRFNILVSNHRTRFGAAAATARPDLHLALWNPFQLFDIAAPSLVTWGYGEGALEAVRAWLEGRAQATARSPVKLFPRAA
jgi:beta-N-acetylhexosaminidase